MDVLRSDNVTAKFNDHYFAEWYIVDDGSGNQKLRVVLKLTDFDYSSWTSTDGSFGHWLGIGFGSSQMSGADIVTCTFKYHGVDAVDDKFTCVD